MPPPPGNGAVAPPEMPPSRMVVGPPPSMPGRLGPKNGKGPTGSPPPLSAAKPKGAPPPIPLGPGQVTSPSPIPATGVQGPMEGATDDDWELLEFNEAPVQDPMEGATDDIELLKQTAAVKQRELARLRAELGQESNGKQSEPLPTTFVEPQAQRRYSLPMIASRSQENCNGAYRLSHLATLNCSGSVADIVMHSGVMAAATWSGELSLWDVESWTDLGSIPASNNGSLSSVAWPTATSELLGLGRNNTVEIWEVGGASEQSTLRSVLVNGSTGYEIEALDSHESQKIICSASLDGVARLWDCTQGKELRELSKSDADAPLSHCHFVGQGEESYQYLTATSNLDGEVHIWDIRVPKVVADFRGPSGALCVTSHGGKHFLSAGFDCGSVVSRELRTWRPLMELKLTKHSCFDTPSASSVGFSGNGRFLAVGDEDGRVTVFDLFRQCTAVSVDHQSDAVHSLLWGDRLSWACTNAWFASASADGTVQFWSQLGRPPEFEP